MFTVLYTTDTIVPDAEVVLRSSTDGWVDQPGEYVDGSWQFTLREQDYPAGFEFKFVIRPDRWMNGANLAVPAPAAGLVLTYTDAEVAFPAATALVTENGVVAQRLVRRNLDSTVGYDVIVVGSGMGGGVLASALADAGASVLVLEAGPYLFPTHVGNLARQLDLGQFQKHVWSLWPYFQVRNYVNVAGSGYAGAQGFNLGGRSIFWGSLVPQLTGWQLAAWPAAVSGYLLGGGYQAALSRMNADQLPDSDFQNSSRAFLAANQPGWNVLDAPVAAQYVGATHQSLPAGIFSTADLLLEDMLVQPQPAGRVPLTVNLNQAVHTVTVDPARPGHVTGVLCYDTLAGRTRSFQANRVVLAAGTIESAKIALQSGLADPNGLIGRGITDHMIRFRHFVVPPGQGESSSIDSAKLLLQHPQATPDQHGLDIVVELGAQLNQGRYVDPNHLAQDERLRNGYLLCEIVFQYYSPLLPGNYVAINGDPANPVTLNVQPAAPSQAELAEADQIAAAVLAAYGAEPVLGEGPGLDLQVAAIGGVAHEVGTLRMAGDGSGVVDADLKFLGYENLYACDNSVFPVSPAANPSLTLVALALRLAGHLTAG